jgi:hypothetical protein
MNFSFFPVGIKNIVFNPVKFWETIKSENTPAALIRNSFLIPLSVLVTLAAFFGSLFFTNSELAPLYSVLFSVKCLLVIFIAVYATSAMLSQITYPLDLGKDFSNSFKMIVVSVTPFLMCQILSRLFESLLFVNIISLYGLYIFWIGAEKILNPPQYKKMPLLIATAISFAGIYIVTDLLLGTIIDRFYFLFFV